MMLIGLFKAIESILDMGKHFSVFEGLHQGRVVRNRHSTHKCGGKIIQPRIPQSSSSVTIIVVVVVVVSSSRRSSSSSSSTRSG